MTVVRGFLIVILSGLAFGAAGAGIGYGLALAAPGYYRGVFNSGREPWFDPAAVGLGLGLTQGAICGVIVGCVIVLAVAWYNARRGPRAIELPPSDALPRLRRGERFNTGEKFTTQLDR
jgi:hypothetical protein